MSRRTVSFLVLSFVSLTVAFSVTTGDTRIHKDIEFADVDGHSLKLDFYLPSAKNPPLVVWIHGRGWQTGNKELCPVKWLTEHGYAVRSISY